MAAHGVFTRRYTSVTIKDGAGTPLSRAVGPGPGDFTFSTVENGNYAAIKVLDRGQFYELAAIAGTQEHFERYRIPNLLRQHGKDLDRKSRRLNSSHVKRSRMPSSA